MKTNLLKKMSVGLLGAGFSILGLTSSMMAAEADDQGEDEIIETTVQADSVEDGLRASVSCSKNVKKTFGSVTCTTSGGAYTIKEVRFDCSGQSDKVYNNVTINGSWSTSYECTFKLTRIQVTI